MKIPKNFEGKMQSIVKYVKRLILDFHEEVYQKVVKFWFHKVRKDTRHTEIFWKSIEVFKNRIVK